MDFLYLIYYNITAIHRWCRNWPASICKQPQCVWLLDTSNVSSCIFRWSPSTGKDHKLAILLQDMNKSTIAGMETVDDCFLQHQLTWNLIVHLRENIPVLDVGVPDFCMILWHNQNCLFYACHYTECTECIYIYMNSTSTHTHKQAHINAHWLHFGSFPGSAYCLPIGARMLFYSLL